MKSAAMGEPQPKPYHRGAFAAEAVPAIFTETLRALAETLEAVLIEQSVPGNGPAMAGAVFRRSSLLAGQRCL